MLCWRRRPAYAGCGRGALPTTCPACATYADARAIQRGDKSLAGFADAAILAEITAGRLFRVMDGDALVSVFSVAYEDENVWGEHERASTSSSRIARRGLSGAAASSRCSRERARVSLGRAGLHGHLGENAALIAFYERLGFRVVARRRIAADPRLPAHYHDKGIHAPRITK